MKLEEALEIITDLQQCGKLKSIQTPRYTETQVEKALIILINLGAQILTDQNESIGGFDRRTQKTPPLPSPSISGRGHSKTFQSEVLIRLDRLESIFGFFFKEEDKEITSPPFRGVSLIGKKVKTELGGFYRVTKYNPSKDNYHLRNEKNGVTIILPREKFELI